MSPIVRGSWRATSSKRSRWLSRADASWSAFALHSSISAPSAGTRRRSCALRAGRSCGRSSRRTGTGTALSMSHGALAGVTALCVATVEALELRAAPALDEARLLVMGPATDGEAGRRAARLELVLAGAPIPDDIPVHLKIDTWDGPLGPLTFPDEERRRRHEPSRRRRVGSGLHEPADRQVSSGDDRARRRSGPPHCEQRRNAAVSPCVVRRRALRHRAVRHLRVRRRPCPRRARARIALDSYVALAKRLEPGDSAGYERRYVADESTWIGVVPVGYGRIPSRHDRHGPR